MIVKHLSVLIIELSKRTQSVKVKYVGFEKNVVCVCESVFVCSQEKHLKFLEKITIMRFRYVI